MPTLCYREVSIIQDITGVPSEGYNPFFFGVDGDALVFRFTQDSFLKVLSALTNGAYITYGDGGRQVVWDFLVNVEYPVSICDLVAECFASDAEFRASVINSLKSDTLFREAIQEISKVGQPLIGGQITGPLVAECDKDAAWSGVLALVQQMSNVNVDFFQFMESQTNELEKISALVSDIPIFGTISASLTSQLVNTLIEDGQENYEGIVTDALLEEYACGLFCIMSDDPSCSLTFNQMYDYFRDRIAGTFNIEDALSVVLEFIVTGTYSGTALVDFMFMTQIAILRDANDFMGFDYVNMQITIDAGRASPSDAWILLCLDCPPEPGCDGDDFTIDEQGWASLAGGTYTEYIEGEGWKTGSASPNRIGIHKSYSGSISKITLTFNMPVTGIMDIGNFTYGYPPAYGTITKSSAAAEWVLEFSASSTGIAIDYRPISGDVIDADIRLICAKVE